MFQFIVNQCEVYIIEVIFVCICRIIIISVALKTIEINIFYIETNYLVFFLNC